MARPRDLDKPVDQMNEKERRRLAARVLRQLADDVEAGKDPTCGLPAGELIDTYVE